MTKAFKLNWRKEVPEELLTGLTVERWTEDGDVEQDCIVKVDSCGFFIYWKSENREGDVLELVQVNDIRPGKVPLNPNILTALRPRHGENIAEKSITVCSGLDMVNINLTHFVFANKEDADNWRNNLCELSNNVKINNVCPMTNLEKHWKRLHMATTVDGQVSVRQIARTFASGKKAENLVYSSLADGGFPSGKNDSIDPETFTFEKFYKIYQSLCPRTDIDDLFSQITSAKEISVKELTEFLNETQRDPRLNEILYPHYDSKRVLEIINDNEKDPDLVKREVISKEGLTNYLMSDQNAPVFLDRLDIYQDMDQPLSHYYINSSHNTYLTGRQFGGKSSVEMYRQVLLAGCRCVELDCWDGKDPDYEPIITHGRAMCSEILFKDVILAIRDCAFVTSDHPLILSFENHCSRQQQYKMAKYCDEIFGDLLLREPFPDCPLIPGQPLPSPNRLKKKIVIKNKRLRPEVEKVELELFRRGELAIEDAEEDRDDPKVGNATASPIAGHMAAIAGSTAAAKTASVTEATASVTEATASDTGSGGTGSTNGSGGGAASATAANTPNTATAVAPPVSGSNPPAATSYQGSTLMIHPFLSSMVNYTTPQKFQGFEFADEENAAYKMSSFAEATAMGYLKQSPLEMVNYNKRQLSRIYPKGARVDSSNFMPQIFWNSGCQLVSLNFQTPDLAMQLNQGRFEYNGNSGFLLKPDFMRRDDRIFDPFAETPVDGVIAANCSVQVISGQFLSDKKTGTYVEVDMYGLPTDTIRKEFRTKTVPANGLNPVYNEEIFQFRKIVLPELAVLRFGVYNEDNKLLGQRILPFEDLQAGYRHIALRTEGNFPMTLPMLFCKIELKVYIPDGLGDFMEALSDPKAFLQAQEEKRAAQLKSYDVEESDIDTTHLVKESGKKKNYNIANKKQPPIIPGVKVKAEEKEELKFDSITPDVVKKEKSFIKLTKKHQKELDSLRKKHQKERTIVQKNQCTAIEKLVKCKGKDNDVVNDPAVKQTVVEQTKHWSEMIDRHQKENWELMKAHLQAQEEVLKKLMQSQQQLQIKELEAFFEKENKEIRVQQARSSVETVKEVHKDNQLKSKAEKERRLREKHSNNTKIFIDERKSAAMRQDQRKQKLKTTHDVQLNDLVKHVQNSLEMYKNEEIEYQLAAQQECFV